MTHVCGILYKNVLVK